MKPTEPQTKPAIIQVPMSRPEIHAILRLIAAANGIPQSIEPSKKDVATGSWVADRLLKLVMEEDA